MEVSEVSITTTKVVPIPEKIQKALGKEATEELVDLINQVAATVSSTKVDKTEYDAHTRLISEQLEAMNKLIKEKLAKMDEKLAALKAETATMIANSRLSTILWTVGLITAITGGWTALIVSLLK